MRGKLFTAIMAAACCLVPSYPAAAKDTAPIGTIEQLQERLGALDSYAASVTYSTLLPSAESEAVYDISLQSLPAADDATPCNYYITWHKASQPDVSAGFAAYSDGDYFRFSDERLHEYHASDTHAPAAAEAAPTSTRFTDLLPAFILSRVKHIVTDSAYTFRFNPDAVYAGAKAVRLDAVESVRGYDVSEVSMTFDAVSGKPLRVTIENNPGTASEQTVTAEYAAAGTTPLPDFTEATLSALYPDIFNRLRERYLSLENLTGTALPQFSHPTLSGDRYTHRRGEAFPRPTVIVVFDPDITSAATINDIRAEVAGYDEPTDIIWAVISRHADTIENLLTPSRSNETVLVGANSFLRSCGITHIPAVISVDREGIIKSAHQ